MPVPVIGVVTGLAAAAGCQLVSSCDLVLATPTARFSTPGASVGLFCHTPGIPLARKEMNDDVNDDNNDDDDVMMMMMMMIYRKVPRAVSGYMLLTGNTITAKEAYNAGLVSR